LLSSLPSLAAIRDKDLELLRDTIAPMVEDAAGRKFKSVPQVDAMPASGIGEVLGQENAGLAHLFFPGLGPSALHAFDVLSRGSGAMVLGKYGLFDQTVYLRSDLPAAWKGALRAVGKETETDPQALAGCVLAHELTHALQAENSPLESIAQGGDLEALAAWNTLAEGHAVWVQEKVCTKLGHPELVPLLREVVGFDGMGPPTPYQAGLHFVEEHVGSIWEVFADPPVDTAMIHLPERYRAGASPPAFAHWSALQQAVVAVGGTEPKLQFGARTGYQALLTTVAEAVDGETALSGFVAGHTATGAFGVGGLTITTIEMQDNEAAQTLQSAIRVSSRALAAPGREFPIPTSVEAPGPVPGFEGTQAWRTLVTMRSPGMNAVGLATETMVFAEGSWVVRAELVNLEADAGALAAAIRVLLRALSAD
jgi:hypothetical protein